MGSFVMLRGQMTRRQAAVLGRIGFVRDASEFDHAVIVRHFGRVGGFVAKPHADAKPMMRNST